jgi:hypothetical protein
LLHAESKDDECDDSQIEIKEGLLMYVTGIQGAILIEMRGEPVMG